MELTSSSVICGDHFANVSKVLRVAASVICSTDCATATGVSKAHDAGNNQNKNVEELHDFKILKSSINFDSVVELLR